MFIIFLFIVSGSSPAFEVSEIFKHLAGPYTPQVFSLKEGTWPRERNRSSSLGWAHKTIRLHHGIVSQEAKTRSIRTPLLHYYHLPFLSILRRISSFSSTSNQKLCLHTLRKRSLLSSLLKWFVSSFFIYLPTKRETKLPHSIFSNCCSLLNLTDMSPSLTPGTFSGPSLQLIPERFFSWWSV